MNKMRSAIDQISTRTGKWLEDVGGPGSSSVYATINGCNSVPVCAHAHTRKVLLAKAMSLVGLSCSTFATLFGNPNLQKVAWLLHVGDIFLTSTLQQLGRS